MEAAAEIGSATVAARADAAVMDVIDEVFQVLALEPDMIRDGHSSWFGWGPLFLGSEDSVLVVGTPDYGSYPLSGPTGDLTLALEIEIDQRRLPEAAEIEQTSIDFQDSILLEPGLNPDTEFFVSWAEVPDHEEPIRVLHSTRHPLGDLQSFEEVQLWRGRQLIPRANPLFAVPLGMIGSVATNGRVELADAENGTRIWSGELPPLAV